MDIEHRAEGKTQGGSAEGGAGGACQRGRHTLCTRHRNSRPRQSHTKRSSGSSASACGPSNALPYREGREAGEGAERSFHGPCFRSHSILTARPVAFVGKRALCSVWEEICVVSFVFACRHVWCHGVKTLFVARPIGHVARTYMQAKCPGTIAKTGGCSPCDTCW